MGRQIADGASFPAPINGLNARDSLALMKPTDAIILNNVFPTPTEVVLRNGKLHFATFTGNQESILLYNGLTQTKVFGGVVDGSTRSIFDMTGAGAVGAEVVGGAGATVQALTSTRFDYVNCGTTGGMFLLACNGADTPLEYDGTTWSVSASTHATLTEANLFTVALYGGRVWYAEKNTFNVYYLPAGAKSGALVQLNLAALFKDGGSINSIITVSDATAEVADYIAFYSTMGEMIAFTGDVADATSWRIAAKFKIGRPVTTGNRTWCSWGVDALVACADGVLPIRKALAAGDRAQAVSQGLTVTDRIATLVNYDLQAHGARFGWDLVVHPTNNKIILNVPTAELSTSRQWVMNTRHGAWCSFSGWDAFCFAVSRDQLYYGGAGYLAKADNDTYFNDDGDAIFGESKQAYNHFGSRTRTKLASMLQATFSMDGSIQISVSVDTDYATQEMPAMAVLAGIGGDPFGGLWDAAWGGALVVQRPWFGLEGEGFAFAPRIKVSSTDSRWRWADSKLVLQAAQGVGL
jgi:hypothetical protein